MLNKTTLKLLLQNGFEGIFPDAFAEAMKAISPDTSEASNEMAKEFGDTLSELLAEPMAEIISGAIDMYIKNASISGNLITYGSPGAHTCSINSPSPITNGIVPNSLKLS